jgi:hypothetical protein
LDNVLPKFHAGLMEVDAHMEKPANKKLHTG